MFWGVTLGVATALMQSCSYLASAAFISRHRSAFKLLISSQLFMGVCSTVLLPFFITEDLVRIAKGGWWYLAAWVTMFFLGQAGFFISQKYIESSRLASLLGLKILVLSAFWMIFNAKMLNYLQVIGVILGVAAAFAMNWSGSRRLHWKGIAALAVTLVCYSLTDLSETAMVHLADQGNVVKAGITITLFCYTVLGICTLPFAVKTGWSWTMQKDSAPFAVIWLGSQMTLLICFGMVGPVFGNVIQSTRGLFSVLLGVLVCCLGISGGEKQVSAVMWLRRGFAALLMLVSIVCFSFGKIIGG
ncbi:MAG: hypothetical protein IKC89_01495 [Lentisphaeria bacterium]|nr:hypothetical protein [Lentisphaeria bacterium]